MKTFTAALLAAALAMPAVAGATVVYDPAESELITAPAPANPANAAAAAADEARLSETIRVWDPAESELATVRIAPASFSSSAVSTHDANRVMKRTWDPPRASS